MSTNNRAALQNLLEAVFNAGRIAAGELVTDTIHKGAYIAITPEHAMKDVDALLRQAEREALEDVFRVWHDEGGRKVGQYVKSRLVALQVGEDNETLDT